MGMELGREDGGPLGDSPPTYQALQGVGMVHLSTFYFDHFLDSMRISIVWIYGV